MFLFKKKIGNPQLLIKPSVPILQCWAKLEDYIANSILGVQNFREWF
jgi:hypothetical protein